MNHIVKAYLQCVHSVQAQGLLNTIGQVGIIEYHIETKCLGSQSYC